ncbi:23S rRNA (uracil(1939)-C(5))-methyltransferase RlmD [Aeromonas hydrophila]|uniref:23S rRNA (uracil(1939)-C(5))-methyltransferase RlmD n=1 Tax=Aeromonas hydrophila TaxID=644 RepID=UPI0004D92661|nr:23S rRNA (uracil(1939)-C(5))-methyltransferase RlmD [Aeromonas hydrophila]EJN6957075.1 23S rRNA (uracil(1939)-C(5))-methyltransferase RlmD [Aeromonas hydrophila]KER64355.1 23S rRNA methyltransferase [Aeromonas hydrophila]OCA66169.1 23S rRNA (uracil(1939)-C(5))-methyltransferase [Aeromonas hydrophila]TNI66510.1 23S rRNA (uracil(1939)-C(5))-methyltransferase [Aeromonas hydrophila]CAD7515835.1 23S rRNA (uracil(1939)-C(5))-methyltransferase RlmD [Aeromonas hydrophila]
MAQFFKPQKKSTQPQRIEFTVDSLDHHCVGIGRHQGKAIFIEGALPGEQVKARILEDKKQYAHAALQQVVTPAANRIAPFCSHYRECGGCSAQHLAEADQRAAKEAGLVSLFERLGNIQPPALEPVLGGESRTYRRVCRLAIKFDKNGRCTRVGFRRRQSNDLVEIGGCPVLAERLSVLISPLRECLNRLKSQRELGHAELIQAEQGILMLLRHTGRPTEADRAQLIEFAKAQGIDLYLQAADEQIEPLHQQFAPSYSLDGLSLAFAPGDFIQVNAPVNQRMVEQALSWLEAGKDDKVLDLFCGIGNFTLPLARQAREVVGVEGELAMVARAEENARRNGINNARFYKADLSGDIAGMSWAREGFDLVLLDPARPGAFEVMEHVVKLSPRRVVYVSCNPVTLARDSQVLVKGGYRLVRLGMLDMFPHTGHLESMALFERK